VSDWLQNTLQEFVRRPSRNEADDTRYPSQALGKIFTLDRNYQAILTIALVVFSADLTSRSLLRFAV
jgi:hypothetical protein